MNFSRASTGFWFVFVHDAYLIATCANMCFFRLCVRDRPRWDQPAAFPGFKVRCGGVARLNLTSHLPITVTSFITGRERGIRCGALTTCGNHAAGINRHCLFYLKLNSRKELSFRSLPSPSSSKKHIFQRGDFGAESWCTSRDAILPWVGEEGEKGRRAGGRRRGGRRCHCDEGGRLTTLKKYKLARKPTI